MDWVRGKALQMVIALREVKPGDQLRCRCCEGKIYTVKGLPDGDDDGDFGCYVATETGVSAGGMRWGDVVAWRRPNGSI